MADEPTFSLKDWTELTVKQKRSRKALYEYVKSVLDGEDADDS